MTPDQSHASQPIREVQRRVLDVGQAASWAGFSKNDALNDPWLEAAAGRSRLRRLAAIQLDMRSPIHIRPLIGVRQARDPKGLALFSRALLNRVRLFGDTEAAAEARALLDWLLEHPAPGFDLMSWGYPYPWQDVGFFAPRHFPNRIVTSNVAQALLDGYETLGEPRYLEAAGSVVRFLLEAPRTLHEDGTTRCVSYVPSEDVSWIVMDVSALAGAAAARWAALTDNQAAMTEAGRLVRYVASKQTPYGAWFYAEPPDASHITHDNYHTGIILDAILEYGVRSRTEEFIPAYRQGLDYYREHLFDPDGAPRFMNHRRWPRDIHGAAQGIISFSLAQTAIGQGAETATRVLRWTLANMWDPKSAWFHYQKRRLGSLRIPLLRWGQAWMAHALGVYLEHCGEPA
jgi:hypothetical protein